MKYTHGLVFVAALAFIFNAAIGNAQDSQVSLTIQSTTNLVTGT